MSREKHYYDPEWSRPIVSAARAIYIRLHIGKENVTPFDDLDIDTYDHYCIAAQKGIRAFYIEAEQTPRE